MPPKRERQSGAKAATPAKPKRAPKPEGPRFNAYVSTNGNQFTVLQYHGFPPLETPRQYETVGDGLLGSQNAFLTIQVPPPRLRGLIESRRLPSVGAEAGVVASVRDYSVGDITSEDRATTGPTAIAGLSPAHPEFSPVTPQDPSIPVPDQTQGSNWSNQTEAERDQDTQAIEPGAHEDFEVSGGKYRQLPATAHNAFITLKLPGSSLSTFPRPIAPGISIPATAHRSFLTLNPLKRASVTVSSLSSNGLDSDLQNESLNRRGSTTRAKRGKQGKEVGGGAFVNTAGTQAIDIPQCARPAPKAIGMAPVKDPNDVTTVIKEVIDNLYDVQSKTHGYIPETQDLLVDRIVDLTDTLSQLRDLTDPIKSPNNPIHDIHIAPEIVDYVDEGRNPDIFTRDFVENVQRGNAVLNGKKQAFRDFCVIFAKKLKEGFGDMDEHVDKVMQKAGLEKQLAEAMNQDTTPAGRQDEQQN